MSISFLRAISDDFHPHHHSVFFVAAGLCATAAMEPGSLIETVRSLVFSFLGNRQAQYQSDSLLIPIVSWAFYCFVLAWVSGWRERRAIAKAQSVKPAISVAP
jgi:hypothetical protein